MKAVGEVVTEAPSTKTQIPNKRQAAMKQTTNSNAASSVLSFVACRLSFVWNLRFGAWNFEAGP
jgi:hypothetical protein